MSNKLKWVLGIFLGLIFLVFIAWQVFKNLKVEKYLRETAQKEINNLWDENVHFNFQNITFKFLQKQIDLKGIQFQIFDKNGTDTLANLTLDRLTLQFDSYRNLIERDTIKIINLSFDRLVSAFPLDFEKIKPKNEDSTESGSNFKIQINEINFKNSSFLFYHQKDKEVGRITSNYDVEIENIYYDSQAKPTIDNLNLKKLLIGFTDFNYNLNDGFHHVSADNISVTPLEGTAYLKNMLFKPIHKWTQFAALKKVQKDHITLKTDSIWFSGFEILDTLAFIGTEIGLKNPELYVHKDKNYEIPDDRFVAILIDKLEATEFPIYIKKLLIENMQLDYKELPKDGEERGHFYFTNMNGVVENITNIKDSVDNLEEKTLNIKATARAFGKGLLDADIRYALQTTNGYFEVNGSLTPMELTDANEIIAPLVPMKIRKGKIDHFEFFFSGDRESTNGEMIFKYSDLKVDVDTEKSKNLKDDLLTFVANIAIPEFNPKPNGKLRIGKISMPKRDTRRSMFKYWIDSLMSGFKSTIGFSEAEEIEKNENENRGKGFWGKLGFGKNKSE